MSGVARLPAPPQGAPAHQPSGPAREPCQRACRRRSAGLPPRRPPRSYHAEKISPVAVRVKWVSPVMSVRRDWPPATACRGDPDAAERALPVRDDHACFADAAHARATPLSSAATRTLPGPAAGLEATFSAEQLGILPDRARSRPRTRDRLPFSSRHRPSLAGEQAVLGLRTHAILGRNNCFTEHWG